MKLLPLASLTLIGSLSLTGCASSPSLEDQAKLVEYENCLEVYRQRFLENLKQYPYSGDPEERIKQNRDYSMEQCKKYRP